MARDVEIPTQTHTHAHTHAHTRAHTYTHTTAEPKNEKREFGDLMKN